MHTTVVIIGAGQAGLAMSHHLTALAVDHVVLERGVVGNAWRTERWDSLRLLTPGWMTRLPGPAPEPIDPDGYLPASEVAALLDGYAAALAAPVHQQVTVEAVRVDADGFRVDTDHGPWWCRAVVDATGAAGTPRVPAVADLVPGHVDHVTPTRYRRPSDLDDGPVLVVGASSSGVQIADELVRSGREVVLAVGDHVRVPRTYRGMDIHWWMDALGILDERIEQVDDPARARRLPSLQLLGSPSRRDLDLAALQASGVEVVGRLVGVVGTTAQLSGGLVQVCTAADLKLGRLLDRIDEFATEHGLDGELDPPTRPAPTPVGPPRTTLELAGLRTVVWATGFRPHRPWLPPAWLDRRGEVRHDRGVADVPGLYVLGLPFLRRRTSSFLDGVGADAGELAQHLRHHLDRVIRPLSTTPPQDRP